MPKQRITKEMVVEAAFELVRQDGPEALQVKNIARKLGCSVQPVYTYCTSMEGMRRELIVRTERFFREFTMENANPENLFHSTGMSQIRLALREPNLFRMYYLRDRPEIHSLKEIFAQEHSPQVTKYLVESLHLSPKKAVRLHRNMAYYTMGVAVMLAHAGAAIAEDEIEKELTSAYLAFLAQAKEDSEDEKENDTI